MGEMVATIKTWMGKLLCCVARPPTPQANSNIDVIEEYANAFRTESYAHFWAHVLELTDNDPATRRSMDSNSAARLPTYRLFAEHLLDPDQQTAARLLALTRMRADNRALLTDYFSETANASLLCGILLKDILETQSTYKSIKKSLEALQITELSAVNHTASSLKRLSQFTKFINPFVPSSPSLARFKAVQGSCSRLLQRLESGRGRTQAKLQVIKNLKCGSVICLVVLTTSITVIVVTHALAIAVAIPGFIVASLDLGSSKRLTTALAQLDAAAKGTYILNKELDTISRQLTRLHDELDHIQTMVGFWLQLRGEDRIQASGEVACQLKKNDSSFSEQLDELEEHLYLSFMTINRARNLVVTEISTTRPASSSSP